MSASNQGWIISTLSQVVGLGVDNFSDGAKLQLLGENSENDGSGANYKWDDASTATHDFPNVIKETITSGAGRWLLMDDHPDWDNTNAFSRNYIKNKPVILPTGGLVMWAGASAPTGFLLCDGSAVSRTSYASLFAITSTTYGNGDGSTTFNLPDLRQRFPLGKAVSGTGATLGDTGGIIDHDHESPVTTGAPNETVQATSLLGGAASPTHTHTVTLTAQNPPFLVINYIIKH